MSDRIEPIRRRTRGPAAVPGVVPLHDDDWRRRREDDATAAAETAPGGGGGGAGALGAAPRGGPRDPGGITRGDDGRMHVDFSA